MTLPTYLRGFFFAFGFHEPQIIEPDVVIVRIGFDFVFVLKASFGDDDVFDGCSIAKLLLVNRVLFVQFGAEFFGNVFEGVLVDDARSLVLLLVLLELGEGDEELLVHPVFAVKLDGAFVDRATGNDVMILLLESRVLDPVFHRRMCHHETLIDGASPIVLFVTKLEVDVRMPRLRKRKEEEEEEEKGVIRIDLLILEESSKCMGMLSRDKKGCCG